MSAEFVGGYQPPPDNRVESVGGELSALRKQIRDKIISTMWFDGLFMALWLILMVWNFTLYFLREGDQQFIHASIFWFSLYLAGKEAGRMWFNYVELQKIDGKRKS